MVNCHFLDCGSVLAAIVVPPFSALIRLCDLVMEKDGQCYPSASPAAGRGDAFLGGNHFPSLRQFRAAAVSAVGFCLRLPVVTPAAFAVIWVRPCLIGATQAVELHFRAKPPGFFHELSAPRF